MAVEYPPATLRVAPHAIPAVREALQVTLDELSSHLRQMSDGAMIPEPWMGDSASRMVWEVYNDNVMQAPDGPFMALCSYRDQLRAARDQLAQIEAEYRRTEGDNAALWGRA